MHTIINNSLLLQDIKMIQKFKPYYLLMLLLIGLCFQLNGQSSDINFDKLTSRTGLSSNTIYSVVQDDLGFVWVGTKSGLNRYDGYHFKTYPIPTAEHTNSSNPTVFSLLLDKQGLIWIGLKDGGLLAYNPSLDKFQRFPFEKNETVNWATITVKSIFEDSRSWLWIGTYGGGTIVLNEKRQVIHHFCSYCDADKKEQLSNDFVFDFEEDKNGNIYIGTAGKGKVPFKEKNWLGKVRKFE